MRARGLKQMMMILRARSSSGESRPMRARGLKQKDLEDHGGEYIVAPHAGAWIETSLFAVLIVATIVAPHAGAWIETMKRINEIRGRFGRAPCGRVD